MRLDTLTSFAKRIKADWSYYGTGLYKQFAEKPIFLYAQAISFKVLVTVVPIVLLSTGILGQVLRREKPFETVAGFIRDFLPPSQSYDVINFIGILQDVSGTLTLIGSLGLIISALTLFTTLRIVLINIFQSDWIETRSIPRGYAFDLRMVAQVGLFFLLTFGLSVAWQTFNVLSLGLMTRLELSLFQAGWQQLVRVLGLLLPLLLTFAMFFQLYYFVPRPRPRKRAAMLGAAVAALLWEGAKLVFTFYATHIGHFDRYNGNTAEDSLAVIGDTFGLIIAFVFWVYFSGIMLAVGAIVALLNEKRHRTHLVTDTEPAPEPLPEPKPDDAPNHEALALTTTAD